MKLSDSQIKYANQFNLSYDEMVAFVEDQEREEQRLKEWWYDEYRIMAEQQDWRDCERD